MLEVTARRVLLAKTACAAVLLLAACTSSSGGGDGPGSALKNLVLYGGTTVPPYAPPPEDDITCPQVDITEGGAAIRPGGDTARYQITINQTARQCTGTHDGGYVLKVGVEGLALLGPGGKPGTYSAPVHIIVKRGSTVIASRTRTGSAMIAAGEAQGTFTIVEDGITVPPGDGDVSVSVGLGAAPAAERAKRRKHG